jgi:hypothetical protein
MQLNFQPRRAAQANQRPRGRQQRLHECGYVWTRGVCSRGAQPSNEGPAIQPPPCDFLRNPGGSGTVFCRRTVAGFFVQAGGSTARCYLRYHEMDWSRRRTPGCLRRFKQGKLLLLAEAMLGTGPMRPQAALALAASSVISKMGRASSMPLQNTPLPVPKSNRRLDSTTPSPGQLVYRSNDWRPGLECRRAEPTR